MKEVSKVNVHRLMYTIKDGMFYILEDGDTVFGPIPLKAKENLIGVLTQLHSNVLNVLTSGKVTSTYDGDIEGTLRLKTDVNDCVSPFIYLRYTGSLMSLVYTDSVVPCKTSCYFHGSIDLMLEQITNGVKSNTEDVFENVKEQIESLLS